MSKTLVLGASGFLGSHVTRVLCELGWTPEPIEESIQQAVDYYLNSAEPV